MRKYIISLMLLLPAAVMAQSAFDLYQYSRLEMRGTARYMSMAGAFGALGGDLSAINSNPGGIGIYRSSDIGVTLDFNIGNSTVESATSKFSTDRFKFYCNNAGYVGALRLDSEIMPNINWGFTYNRSASFNRHYRGKIDNLNTSFSNYMAGVAVSNGRTDEDLAYGDYYNPYLDGDAGWMEILAYNSYMINTFNGDDDFRGLFGDGTSGCAIFETIESGGIDDFTFNLGGNVANTLYWGMSLGISSIEHNIDTYYRENLQNAYVAIPVYDEVTGETVEELRSGGSADYDIHNYSRTTGTGVNFKLGLIFKPINELRLGFAFHTPTFYSLKNEYYTDTQFDYVYKDDKSELINSGYDFINDGYVDEFTYNMRTPWRFVASAAAVIGGRGILSFDYEYVGYQTMSASDDYGSADAFVGLNNDVKTYYRPSHIFKVGAEYRVTNNFSVRAGYSYQTSASVDRVRNDMLPVYTTLMPASYETENNTQHITVGLGYKYKQFYTDLAFVHRDRQSDYHAFSPVIYTDGSRDLSPSARINNYDNQIVWTLGFRF